MLLHRHVRDSAIKNGNWVVIQLKYNYSTLPSNYGTWMESSIFFLLCNRIKYTWEKKKEMESDESYKVKQSEKVRDLEKKKLNFFLFSRVSAHECFKSFCRLPRREREVVNRLTCFSDMKRKKPQWFISKMWRCDLVQQLSNNLVFTRMTWLVQIKKF